MDSSGFDASELYAQGIEYLKRGRIDEARAIFKEVLRSDPEYAPGPFGLGCVYAFQGLKERAVEEWTKCIQIEPRYAEAHYTLAWAYYDAGDAQKGYKHLKVAMDAGVPLDTIIDLVERFVRTGQPMHIEATDCPPAIDSIKKDEETGLKRSEIGKGEHKKEETDDLNVLYQRGVVALREGSIDKAIEILEQLVSSDPNRPDFHFALGGAYSAKGAWLIAIEEWKKTVELDPGNKHAHHNLAISYRKIGLLEKAEYYAEIAKRPLSSVKDTDSAREAELKEAEGEAVSVEQIQVEATQKPWAKGVLITSMMKSDHIYHVFSCLLIGLVCFMLLKGTFNEGFPRGYFDATLAFYVAKVKMLLEKFVFYTPSWYFGYEFLRFYPPLSTLIPYFTAILSGNLMLSYYYLCFFFYTMFCIGIYFFIQHFLKSKAAGLFAGVLWSITHVNIISFQGHYWETCRLFGTAMVPLVLYFADRAIAHGRRRDILATVILTSYVLLSSVLSAFDLAFLLLPFGIVRGTLMPYESVPLRYRVPRRTMEVLKFGFIGVLGLCLWWYLPAVLPYGVGGFVTTGRGGPPSILKILFQMDPPGWMPAVQLPVTLIGLMGASLAAYRRDRRGMMLVLWLVSSILTAYLIGVQSVRLLLLIGLALVFLGGYLIKELPLIFTQFSSNKRRGEIVSVFLVLSLLTVSVLVYLPRYREYAVVDYSYLNSDEYVTASWLHERVDAIYRVYVMYGSHYRGVQWINMFYPELMQVLGGFDQGALNLDDAPFVFDSLVKSGTNSSELHQMARRYHVKYIVIDGTFMNGRDAYIKFFDETFFKPVRSINEALNHAMTFEVIGVEPLSESGYSYSYYDKWRILGVIFSLVFLIYFMIIIGRHEGLERWEEEVFERHADRTHIREWFHLREDSLDLDKSLID